MEPSQLLPVSGVLSTTWKALRGLTLFLEPCPLLPTHPPVALHWPSSCSCSQVFAPMGRLPRWTSFPSDPHSSLSFFRSLCTRHPHSGFSGRPLVTAVLGLLRSLRHAPRAYCHWPANNVFSEHSSSPLECKLPESRGFVKYAHRLGHNKWPVNICLVDECFLKKGRLIFL